METSTPSRDSRDDLRNDSTGRHGDVDKNGDLVDELRELAAFEVAAIACERDARLREAICAASPRLEADQLRGVKQLLRPWTVTP